MTLFEPAEALDGGPIVTGRTTIDRLHQAMLLFANGRGEIVRKLLADPNYAGDERFLRLARSLSALYPATSHEKRWLDGVLGATRQVR